jgi:hypothetical protein
MTALLEPKQFDYATLDTTTRSWLEQTEIELTVLILQVQELGNRYVSHVLQVGERLSGVRDRLRHNKSGGFELWCESKGWSRRQAYNYLSAYEQFGNCATVAQFDIAPSALWMLSSAPDSVRQAAIALGEQGEAITVPVAKELVAKHKPKPFDVGETVEICSEDMTGQAVVTEVNRDTVTVELPDGRSMPMLYGEVSKVGAEEAIAPTQPLLTVKARQMPEEREALLEFKLRVSGEKISALEDKLNQLHKKVTEVQIELETEVRYSEALCVFIQSVIELLPPAKKMEAEKLLN